MRLTNKDLRDITFCIIASLLAAVTIKQFAMAAGLVPSGFSGLSIIIIGYYRLVSGRELSYSLIYLVLNLPAVLLVVRNIGIRFISLSVLHIALTSIFVELTPLIDITKDIVLLSVFGGIISGIANALVVYAGACGGGIDFIAIFLAQKRKQQMWNLAFAINATIIIGSGFLYGWDSAMYSIIYQFVASQILNLLDSKYKRTSFFVITEKSDEIKELILRKHDHGLTIWDSVGAYTGTNRKVLFAVVGTYEIEKLIQEITSIDPYVFINVIKTQRLVGHFSEKVYNEL